MMRGMKMAVVGAASIIGGALVYLSGGLQEAVASGQEMMGSFLIVMGLLLGGFGIGRSD